MTGIFSISGAGVFLPAGVFNGWTAGAGFAPLSGPLNLAEQGVLRQAFAGVAQPPALPAEFRSPLAFQVAVDAMKPRGGGDGLRARVEIYAPDASADSSGHISPVLASPFFGLFGGGDKRTDNIRWVVEKLPKQMKGMNPDLEAVCSRMDADTKASLEDMIGRLFDLGVERKDILDTTAGILKSAGQLDRHKAVGAAPKMIGALAGMGKDGKFVVDHLTALADSMSSHTSGAYDAVPRLVAAGLTLDGIKDILVKAKACRISKHMYGNLADVVGDSGPDLAGKVLDACGERVDRALEIYPALRGAGFSGEDLVAYLIKATITDLEATPALLRELKDSGCDATRTKELVMAGLGRVEKPEPRAEPAPKPRHEPEYNFGYEPVRTGPRLVLSADVGSDTAKVRRPVQTMDELSGRILKEPVLTRFFRKFLSLDELSDENIRASFAERGIGADVADSIVHIFDVVSRHAPKGLDKAEFEAMTGILKLAVEKGCVKEASDAVDNSVGRKVKKYDGNSEVHKRLISDFSERNVNAKDLLSRMKVIIAVAGWKQMITRYDLAALTAVAPHSLKVVDLMDDLVAGKINVAFEPTMISHGAHGLYATSFDTVYLKDFGETGSFTNGYDESIMCHDQVVIHELVHAVQARKLKLSETVRREAEAHAIEMLYCLLKFGEANVRNYYRKGMLMVDDENSRTTDRKMAGYFGEELVLHLNEQHKKQSFRLAALDWAVESLNNVRDGRSAEVSFSEIEERYTLAQGIPKVMSYFSREELTRQFDKAVSFMKVIAQQIESTLAERREDVAGFKRVLKDRLQGSHPAIVEKFGRNMEVYLLQCIVDGLVFKKNDPKFDAIKYFDEIVIPMVELTIIANYH